MLLYLLLTLAPFAVIAPVFGPLLDRTRGGRRLMFAATMAARAVLCLIMAAHVNGLALYPLAFGALVLSKTQSVTKSALVPGVIKNKGEFVLANSRLAFISILGGIAAGPVAAVILRVAHAPWVLRAASVIFLLGMLAALGLPRAEKVARAETVDEREALHTRSILAAGTRDGPAARRGRILHVLRRVRAQDARTSPRGSTALVLMMSAVGTGDRDRARARSCGAGSARSGSWPARSSCPSIPLVFAARSYGRAALDRRRGGDRGGVGDRSARVRQPPATRRRRRGPRPGVRALRDALPARVGARRGARGHLPGRRPGRDLPRRAGAAVRRACRTSARSRRPDAGRRADVPTETRENRPTVGRSVRVERADAARGPPDHRRRAAGDARGRPARFRRAAAPAGASRQLGARRARPHAVRVRRRHDGRVHAARTRSS